MNVRKIFDGNSDGGFHNNKYISSTNFTMFDVHNTKTTPLTITTIISPNPNVGVNTFPYLHCNWENIILTINFVCEWIFL